MLSMLWTSDLSYALGLIVSDGSLSKDGRHIDFTSKDLEQIYNLKTILKLKNKIGIKYSGRNRVDMYFRIQFSNVKLYKFLVSIGLRPRKSKLLKELLIPDKHFRHFLRGCLDGDGYTYSYWDRRWKSSFRLYSGLVSASLEFLKWVQGKIKTLYDIEGTIRYSGKSTYHLEYATKNSMLLLDKIYKGAKIVYLKRKKYKFDKSLAIIKKQAGMLKLVDRHA